MKLFSYENRPCSEYEIFIEQYILFFDKLFGGEFF